MLAGGSNLYLKKHFKSKKEKVKLNGISFKAGYSISKFTETFLSIGWAHESFKVTNKTHSFIFELGGGMMYMDITGDYEFFGYSNSGYSPLVYWKLHWSWYGQ